MEGNITSHQCWMQFILVAIGDYGNMNTLTTQMMYLTYMPSSVQLLPQVTVDSVHLVLQSVKLHSSGGQSLWRWNIYDHLSRARICKKMSSRHWYKCVILRLKPETVLLWCWSVCSVDSLFSAEVSPWPVADFCTAPSPDVWPPAPPLGCPGNCRQRTV